MAKFFKKAFIALSLFSTALWSAEPLKIWIMPNGASPKEKLEERLNIFTKQTGIQTDLTVLDWGEAWNRISVALTTGKDAPDVVQLGTTWVPYFAARGEIKPLNSYKNLVDAERFVPVSFNTAKIEGDTVIYSIPWFIDIRPLLGNKRFLEINGIKKEDIATYEGFVEAVRKINASNEMLDGGLKVEAYAFPGKSDWNIPHNFAPWIWSHGGNFIVKNSEGKFQANILQKETLKGIAKYLYFVIDSLVPASKLQLNTAEIVQQFNNGELAFIVNTAEIVMQTRFAGKEGGLQEARIGSEGVEVLPFPRGKNGSVSFIGGSNLAIPAKNTRKESLKLLEFLTNDENLEAYTKQIGFLPSSKKVLEKWAEDEAYRELLKALETGKTYVPIPEWGDIEQILVAMFSNVWSSVEIPALYSEEKIYDILKEYSNEINKRLGATSQDEMSKEEFLKVWHEVFTTEIAKEPETEKKQTAEVDPLQNNLSKAPWVFAFILWFFIRFKKKA